MPGLVPRFWRNRTENLWLYKVLAKGVHWGKTREELETYATYASIVVGVITIAIILISWMFDSSTGVYVVLGAGALSFILVDFACIFFAVTTTATQTAQLDLLRLTALSSDTFVQTLHQIVQVRAWRVLVLMQAVRFVIVFAILTFGIMLVLLAVLVTFGAGLLWMAALLALTLAEPIWRLEAITAIGVMAAARWHNATAWLVAVGGMFALWVVQGLAALVPIWAMRFGSGQFGFVFLLSLALPALAFGVRWGQHRVRDACLGYAQRVIFDPVDEPSPA